MQIVGCDFHPSFQQVAILDVCSGEVRELKLMHADGEAGAVFTVDWSRRC
jgi:transposase